MLVADQGIVFHQFKYTDSTVIAKIFTRKHGMRSVVIKGVRSKKSNASAALQPLSLVDIEYYNSEKKDLCTGKSISIRIPYNSLYIDVFKSAVTMFLAELLYKSLHHQEAHDDLFEFIETYLIQSDSTDFSPDSHLWFTTRLTQYLGIEPNREEFTEGKVLELSEGNFVVGYGRKGDSTPEVASAINKLLGTKFAALSDLKLTVNLRRAVLDTLVNYYQIQLEGINSINSHRVLKELLE